jgi:heme/copper-type cytochrome/quinol oxidase subunit 2
MYCSTCGAALAQGLSYCNRCGARSGADARDADRPRPETLVMAMVTVFVFGIAAFTGLLAVMKHYGINDGLTNGFTMMVFLLMVAIEAVFIWMLLSGRRAAEGKQEAARLKEQTTQELEGANARALQDAPPSVTEHATRTFEPAYRERGLK